MIIYLASVINFYRKKMINENFLRKNSWFKDLYVLESYEYIKNMRNFAHLKSLVKGIIIDSGAYTFQQNKKSIDWEKYAIEYGEFIKTHNIKYFFELDIDNVVGYDEVKRLRNIIETIAGRRSIPVWHINRGKEEFIEMCKAYDYVAIGGLVGKSGDRNKILYYLRWFVDTAHQYNAKIHGLGFTINEGIKNIPFDSVDSTTWLNGGKYGVLFVFDNGKLNRINSVNNGLKTKQLKNYQKTNLENLHTWYRLQKYALKKY